MKSRKLGVLTAAAIALGLAIAPVASFAAAPRAAGQFGQSDGVTQVAASTAQKKPPPKKSVEKKKIQKKTAKPASTAKKT